MTMNKEMALLCSECANPLEIERHDTLGWHVKPCEKCLEAQREEIVDELGEEECYGFRDTCSICALANIILIIKKNFELENKLSSND